VGLALFAEAMDLVSKDFLFDAIQSFERIAKDGKTNDLADDALVNAGLCYMKMSLFRDAVAQFTRVIQGYPDATIADCFGGQERGRTAAKALYCRMRCHVALGDHKAAEADLKALEKYQDSFVVGPDGNPKTFHALATEALATAK
jgi:TolA-binding protein